MVWSDASPLRYIKATPIIVKGGVAFAILFAEV